MKYCTRCKKISLSNENEKCSVCGKKLISDPSHYSPVNIITANGFELERIKAALTDAEVAFSVQETRRDAGIQILNAAPPENCNIFVPLSDYEKAIETLAGIGAVDAGTMPEFSETDQAFLKESAEQAQKEEMSPKKRFWVRLLSGLGFLLILAAVVYLTDFLTGFIKGLF